MNKKYTEEDLLLYIAKLNGQWFMLKKKIRDYRFKKTGSDEDGRYCVAISVTDLLSWMDDLEDKNE